MKNLLRLILFSCILLHSLALPGQFQHSDSIFATIPYYGEETWPNGNFANGTYSLYSHTAQNLSQVDQALIIVEGWDPIDQFKAQDIFLSFDRSSNNFLATRLLNEGYDIIILDFGRGGADYIQRNAFVLTELLQLINNQKTGSAQNVLIGISMGGLVARYATTYMEYQGLNPGHDCRLLVSYDTPNQGAYIPLSIQFALARTLGSTLALSINWHQMFTRSAEQMLSHYLYPNETQISTAGAIIPSRPSPKYQDFFNELQLIGNYPNCRNIAVANGSRNGVQHVKLDGSPFDANDIIAEIDMGLVFGQENDCYPLSGNSNNTQRTVALWLEQNVAELPDIDIEFVSRDLLAKGQLNDPTVPNMLSVPGSINPIVSQLSSFNIPNFLSFNFHEPNFSFISTFSALDIDLPLEGQSILNMSNIMDHTPFDAIYGPVSANATHTALSSEIANWLFDEIEYQNTPIPINQLFSFNFGNETNNFLFQSYAINSGGELLFNSNQATGYFNFDLFGKPGPNPNVVREFFLSTTQSSSINALDGGEIIVGDPTFPALSAELHVQKNCEIELERSGKLQINNQSRVIIEEGAMLTASDGLAIIELNGENSELVIEGKVIVQNGATLRISGTGRVIFDQKIWKSDPNGNPFLALNEFWEIDPNAEILFEGSQSFSSVILETKSDFVPKMADGTTFKKISFKRGKLLIGENAPMHCFGSLDMSNIEIDCSEAGKKHDGFRIHQNPGSINLNNLRFKNGKKALIAHWYGSSSPLRASNLNFTDNDIGLFCDRGNFQIENSNFTNNIQGILGNVISGTSELSNTDFANNSTGVLVSGQAGTALKVDACNFVNNNEGIRVWQSDIYPRCSQFIDHFFAGIYAEEGLVYLNNEAGNQFYNNQHGVYLKGYGINTGIFLENGGNEFGLNSAGSSSIFTSVPTKTYIYGALTEAPPSSSYHNTLTDHILADGNKMPLITISHTNSSQALLPILPVSIHYSTGTGPASSMTSPVYIHLVHSASVVSSNCMGSSMFDEAIPTLSIIQNLPDVGSPLGGGKWSGLTVKQALLESLTNISFDEHEGDDVKALNDLQEILNSKSSSLLLPEQQLLNITYNLMHLTIGTSFRTGQLIGTNNETGLSLNEIDQTIKIIDTILANINPLNATAYSESFTKQLEKVQVYRISEQYDKALDLLSKDHLWAVGSDLNRTGFWTCICNAEKQLIEGSIDTEALIEKLNSCNQLFSGNNFKNQNYEPVKFYQYDSLSSSSDLTSYPQPVQDQLTIELPAQDKSSYELKIYNSNGQVITTINGQTQNNIIQLNLEHLIPGIYHVVINQNKGFKILKVEP